MIPKKIRAFVFFTVLALVPACVLRAQGTPADSGECPWKLPFLIYFDLTYEQENSLGYLDINNGKYDKNLSTDTVLAETVISKWIDTSIFGSSYTFSNNKLSYTLLSNFTQGLEVFSSEEELTITFVSGLDSIASFTYYSDTTVYDNSVSWEDNTSVGLNGLKYDTSSIINPQKSLNSISFSKFDSNTQNDYDQKQSVSLWLISMSFGGIFEPDNIPSSVIATHNLDFKTVSYPNPFTLSSTISFTPETSGYADVSIVNLLGAEVAHLFSGELAAGEHSFVWSNSTGLPDGTYECLIRSNGQVQTLPMVMMH